MRLSSLAPALALLAAAPAAFAGDAAERDQHFDAVVALASQDFALPAVRQLEAFASAGYPDEVYAHALAWYLGEVLGTRVAGQTAATLDARVQRAKAVMEAAAKEPARQPARVRDLLARAGTPLGRLLTELTRRDMAFQPWGFVDDPAETIPAERIERVVRLVDRILAELDPAFAKAKAAIDANKPAEDKMWDFDEKDKRHIELKTEAIRLRTLALEDTSRAVTVLREISLRGAEEMRLPAELSKRIDDTLAAFLTKYKDHILEYSFRYGEDNAFLYLYGNILRGEALRHRVRGISAEEVVDELVKVVKFDVKDIPPSMHTMLYSLQLRCLAAAFTAYQNQGTPPALAKAEALWKEMTTDKSGLLRPGSPVTARHSDKTVSDQYGLMTIAAARAIHAKGNAPMALGILGSVASVRTNAVSGIASRWVKKFTTNDRSSSQGGWGDQPTAVDPEMALNIANSFIQSGRTMGDPDRRRQTFIKAAVSLRNGVLGLSTPGFERSRVAEVAPRLFDRYAIALNSAEMHWHAAVVSAEGMRALVAAGGDAKNLAGNPWRGKDGKLIEGEAKQRLWSFVKNASAFASRLRARTDGSPGALTLAAEISRLHQQLLPELPLTNPWIDAIDHLNAGRFAQAIEAARQVVRANPAERWFGIQFMVGAYQRWHSSLMRKNETSPLTARERDEAAKVLKELDELVARQLPATQQAIAAEQGAAKPNGEALQAMRRAEKAMQGVRFYRLLQENRFAEVLAALDAKAWTPPPSDPSLGAAQLGVMAQAAVRFARAELTTRDGERVLLKPDPAALLAVWPRLRTSAELYQNLVQRYDNEDTGPEIARSRGNLYQALLTVELSASNLQSFSRAANAPEAVKALTAAQLTEIAAIQKAAATAYANIYEPVISDRVPASIGPVINIAIALQEAGEYKRAARVYDVGLRRIAGDQRIKEYQANPKAFLDALNERIVRHPTMGRLWLEVRDLLEESDAARENRIRTGEETKGDLPVDYVLAGRKLAELRAHADANRTLLGGLHADIAKAADELAATVGQLAQRLSLLSNYAYCLRATGEKAKANEIYLKELLPSDPTNLEYVAAVIDITLDQLRNDPAAVGAEQIAKAIEGAAKVRDASDKATERWWLANLQIMELRIFSRDKDAVAKVNETLEWMRIGRTDISFDLVRLNRWDDVRVRRARDAQSVSLARRFLALYEANGITAKPQFAIQEYEGEGARITAFTAIDAPAMAVGKHVDAQEVETVFVHPAAMTAADHYAKRREELFPPKPPEPDAAGSATAPASAPAASATTAPRT